MSDYGALEAENAVLRANVKKLEREVRMAQSFLHKVTRASEAKDAIGNALSQANARQKSYTDLLLHNCPSIIVLLDDAGRFVLSTNALMEVTGTPNFDFIKNHGYEEVFAQYFSRETFKMFRDAMQGIPEPGDATEFNAWIDFSKDGKPHYYSVGFRRVGREEHAGANIESGVLIVMLDYTELMLEKQRAEAASNAKSDFLAVMSHEIRTPMNAIIGLSTALDRMELSPEASKFIKDIQRASDSLLGIITDVLDFSKIEAGKMETVSEDFCLLSMLESLRSMFELPCREKQLELRFKISPDLPANICGDETHLRQILTNLLSNAVKYTRKGRVVFSAWIEGDNRLRFDIQDTGIGIREAESGKLFKPFEQLDLRRNRDVVGTGLGLAIVYNLCRLMGGDIWLNSVYGEGSTFSVYLPFVPALGAVEAVSNEVKDFFAPDARVLVVDDMDSNLIVAEVMLEMFDILPDMVGSAARAINLTKLHRYDMIFMDHMMPVMDGVEATREIRSQGGHNAVVPIIALTANVVKGTEQMFKENGMDAVLPKPLDYKQLNSCLRKWLPVGLIEEDGV
ncbi:MAG: ATP-binding protein [Defluviitaleaceae bacterium]|nr:ATP-binding protein [Defluviitaleaceae bacterium]